MCFDHGSANVFILYLRLMTFFRSFLFSLFWSLLPLMRMLWSKSIFSWYDEEKKSRVKHNCLKLVRFDLVVRSSSPSPIMALLMTVDEIEILRTGSITMCSLSCCRIVVLIATNSTDFYYAYGIRTGHVGSTRISNFLSISKNTFRQRFNCCFIIEHFLITASRLNFIFLIFSRFNWIAAFKSKKKRFRWLLPQILNVRVILVKSICQQSRGIVIFHNSIDREKKPHTSIKLAIFIICMLAYIQCHNITTYFE